MNLDDFTASAGISTAIFAGAIGFLIFGNMSRLLGRATTHFFTGKNSIRVRTKDGKEMSLIDLCKSVLPPCWLNPFLFNGHLQTMWTVLKTQTVPIYYKRRIFEQQDPAYPGSFAVDFVTDP